MCNHPRYHCLVSPLATFPKATLITQIQSLVGVPMDPNNIMSSICPTIVKVDLFSVEIISFHCYRVFSSIFQYKKLKIYTFSLH